MYGIWNDVEKRFVFGITETTKDAAWRKFVKRVGKTSYKWRFEARAIPKGFSNPKNPHYQKQVKQKEGVQRED